MRKGKLTGKSPTDPDCSLFIHSMNISNFTNSFVFLTAKSICVKFYFSREPSLMIIKIYGRISNVAQTHKHT